MGLPELGLDKEIALVTELINTVSVAIPSDRLGKTLIHEHFVFGYPGFQKYSGEKEFSWADALKHGITMAERMQARGVQTVVDPTPNECGRNPQLLKEIAESTGLQIICATGYYYESKHSPEIYKLNQGSTQTEDAICDCSVKNWGMVSVRRALRPEWLNLLPVKG